MVSSSPIFPDKETDEEQVIMLSLNVMISRGELGKLMMAQEVIGRTACSLVLEGLTVTMYSSNMGENTE